MSNIISGNNVPDIVSLGIDTSNYTTSLALFSTREGIILNRKIPLSVKDGETGLRQSSAVFEHIKNFESLDLGKKTGKIDIIGVSSKPRPVNGSYMPCFLVGSSFANMLSQLYSVPHYTFSHQEGHIIAALYSSSQRYGFDFSEILNSPLYSFHISGGTTELLFVRPGKESIIEIEKIGGTIDLNAGQVIDRIGVRMGFKFPSGRKIDELAQSCNQDDSMGVIRTSVKETYFNLSGLQNLAEKMICDGESPESVSRFVLSFIAETLERVIICAKNKYGDYPVIFAGGVMSSVYISGMLEKYGYFADNSFSSDNAAGISVLAALEHLKKTNE